LLPEGVVFGCDSTWTIPLTSFEQTDDHYFNHGQKLFEIGQNSTLGIMVWGLNSFPEASIRTMVATFGDSLAADPPANVQQIAARWATFFWDRYLAAYAEQRARVKELQELVGKQEEGAAEAKKARREARGCGKGR